MEDDLRIGGRLERVSLDRLEPDALNPRLPPSVQRRRLDASALFAYVDKAYDVLSIAESIVRHGYFESEPLVAVSIANAYPEEEFQPDDARLVVVEGNRRLAALKALADPQLRAELPSAGWRRLPENVPLPATLPVLIVDSREKAAPILGFRHITRSAPWDPYPQAKYIAGLVDEQKRSFSQVASLLDRSESEVRSYYRNYWLLRQSEDDFGLPDVERITDSFGVFTRAMQNPDLRAYINAPDPRDVHPDYWPMPTDGAEHMAKLTTWLFGEPRSGTKEDARPPRPGQVLLDSRQITQLGRALSHEQSLHALDAGLTLHDACETLVDPLEALLRGLRDAAKVLRRAHDAFPGSAERLERLVVEIEAAIDYYEGNLLAGPGA